MWKTGKSPNHSPLWRARTFTIRLSAPKTTRYEVFMWVNFPFNFVGWPSELPSSLVVLTREPLFFTTNDFSAGSEVFFDAAALPNSSLQASSLMLYTSRHCFCVASKKILSVTASGRSLVKSPQSFYHRIISGGCACCSLRKERFLFQNRSKQSNLLGHCETLRNYFIPELEIASKFCQEGKSIG